MKARKPCKNCGKPVKENRCDYCSRACADKLKIKTDAPTGLRRCAACLLEVGFGNRCVTRWTLTPKTTVRRLQKDWGVFSQKRSTVNWQSSKSDVDCLEFQRAAFIAEQAGMQIGDEGRHWKNHRLVAIWNYYRDHEKSKLQGRESAKRRWKTDLNYRIKSYLRSRLNKMVKTQGARKAAITEALLGCTIPEVRAYLANKFEPGMSWDNHGDWHIDHVRPCASFDLRDPEQQRQCFHYTNLRPMWGTDNISKGSYFEGKKHRHVKVKVSMSNNGTLYQSSHSEIRSLGPMQRPLSM